MHLPLISKKQRHFSLLALNVQFSAASATFFFIFAVILYSL